MSKQIEFIEVKRVVSENNINVGSRPESYPIDSIFTFREWHKGKNDNFIQGDMTIIVFRPKEKTGKTAVIGENGDITERSIDKNKLKTILIEESYESFLNRMSSYVPVRRVPEE
jgi:hypothetical protein